MKRVIYKYQIDLTDRNSLMTPGAPQVRHIGVQGGTLYAWIEHDHDDNPDHPVVIWCTPTGAPFDRYAPDGGPLRYINTIQDGAFIWHFYQEMT